MNNVECSTDQGWRTTFELRASVQLVTRILTVPQRAVFRLCMEAVEELRATLHQEVDVAGCYEARMFE